MTDDTATQLAEVETATDEGFKAGPYLDTEKRWSIARGRCLETHPLSGAEWKMLFDRGYLQLSISQAGATLLESLQLAMLTARLAHDYDFWPKLNDARKAALLEWAYQIGADGEEAFHETIAAIRKAVTTNDPQDWGAVKLKGLASLWAQQTPARAQRVMAQLASGECREGT